MYEFELGPIRPPSEAHSVLLRITRNCPWNKCAFCPVYKNEKFSLRSIDEIKGDIARAYFYMSNTYNINLSDQERKMMEAWDKQDPIDEWEIEKNKRIEKYSR